MTLFLIAAASYLLGSIPFGYLLVRMFRGEDVRQSGSGNIGATNVSRKSPALGILTLLLDAGKGAASVALSLSLSPMAIGCMDYLHRTLAPSQRHAICGSTAALFAIVGHIFPVWLRFRGGKGVATALGAFALLAPRSVLVSAAVFLIVVAFTRYVSLGSIFSVALFPVAVWRLHDYGQEWVSLLFTSLASLLVIAKHHQNIRRLLAGTENRIGARHAAPGGNP
jgi:acyl phosphate:glycerol-3-phosphate acyltransferase